MQQNESQLIIDRQHLVTNHKYFNDKLQDKNIFTIDDDFEDCYGYGNKELGLYIISNDNKKYRYDKFDCYGDQECTSNNYKPLEACIKSFICNYNLTLSTRQVGWQYRLHDGCNLRIYNKLSRDNIELINRYTYDNIDMRKATSGIVTFTKTLTIRYAKTDSIDLSGIRNRYFAYIPTKRYLCGIKINLSETLAAWNINETLFAYDVSQSVIYIRYRDDVSLDKFPNLIAYNECQHYVGVLTPIVFMPNAKNHIAYETLYKLQDHEKPITELKKLFDRIAANRTKAAK